VTAPKPPAIVKQSAVAEKAWNDIWRLLDEQDMTDPAYVPTVTALAMELGIAEEMAAVIYSPIHPETGKPVARTLDQYLSGSGPKGLEGKPRNSQTTQALTVLRDSLKQIARLAAEFGSSPLAKKRLGVGKKDDEESPMMAYIRATNERLGGKRKTG
jgi:phage terminase small subunit